MILKFIKKIQETLIIILKIAEIIIYIIQNILNNRN